MNMKHQVPRRIEAMGAGLIELMVSILIGSIVLVGILIITANSSNVSRQTDAQGGLTDTGQTSLQLLAADVRMAGYSLPRTYYAAGYTTKMLSTAGIRGCDNGFTNANSAADITTLSCNTTPGTAGAGLSVSYEADGFNAVMVTGATGQVPSDCRGFGLVALPGMQGNTLRPVVAEDSMSSTPAYWLVENRYFIAPNANDNNEPTLFCAGNGTNTPFQGPLALVSGVERMVITYGVANATLDASRSDSVLIINDPSVIAYMSANDIDTNAAWTGEPTNVRWQRVVSVRMCLETRGATGSALQPNPSYINCNGTSTAITDARARRTVRMTMNLRNRTMSVDSTQGIGVGGV